MKTPLKTHQTHQTEVMNVTTDLRPPLPPRLNRASVSPVFVISNAQHHEEGFPYGI